MWFSSFCGLWNGLLYFGSVSLPRSSSKCPFSFLIMEYSKYSWRCRRFRHPHYVHFKEKLIIDNSCQNNVIIFIAFWEIDVENSPLSPRSSSNSLINVRFDFQRQVVHYKVFKTFITVV
jgi:hypothetical protein